jgi:hypothetical protein
VIEVRIDGVERLRRELAGFSERRLAAAVATALTRTAAQARDDVQAGARAALDRPTPYTLRQLRYVPATAQRLVAGVGWNIAAVADARGVVTSYRELAPGETPASRYLPVHTTGGTRGPKRFERLLQRGGLLPPGWYAVPGQGVPLDAYGNVSAGLVRQVLSQLRIEPTQGATSALPRLSAEQRRLLSRGARGLTAAETSARKDALAARARIVAAQRRAGGQFFAIAPGTASALPPGIYQRELMGRDIRPIFVFVDAARYRARFDFVGIVRRAVLQHRDAELKRAIAEQQRRLAARRSGGDA